MLTWRNRLLAHPGFQRWAARTPLVRMIAHARANRLFDLLAGFAYSQITLACVESGLLDFLVDGPRDLAAIAGHIRLEPAAATRLLRAAGALDLAEEPVTGWWMLGPQGAVLQANAGACAMIRHHRLLYADLADPLALLRANRTESTALARFWRYDGADADAAAAYSELMSITQRMVAEQVLGTIDLRGASALLDVGGGHGEFARQAAARFAGLRIGIFDLPNVLARTAQRLEAEQAGNHITCHPGNFFDDPLPAGYDCISLVRILHDHDDEFVLRLLASARRALPPGGQLIIAEPLAGTRGSEPMGDAYFGMYLWAMNSGQPRSAAEMRDLLRAAGFPRSRLLRTANPLITSIIVCVV